MFKKTWASVHVPAHIGQRPWSSTRRSESMSSTRRSAQMAANDDVGQLDAFRNGVVRAGPYRERQRQKGLRNHMAHAPTANLAYSTSPHSFPHNLIPTQPIWHMPKTCPACLAHCSSPPSASHNTIHTQPIWHMAHACTAHLAHAEDVQP